MSRKLSVQAWLCTLWFLFVMVVNLLWLTIDQRPPRWDESANLWFSERAYQLVKEFKIVDALETHGVTRPNFIPFLTGMSYFLVGHSTQMAIFLLNFFSFLLIFISLYYLGKLVFDKTAGFFACVLFTTYPGISLWSRYYSLDIPLAAVVSVTVLLCVLVLQSEFRQRRWQVLLGLSVAAGICVKHLYAGYVFGPLGLLVFYAFRKWSNLEQSAKKDHRRFVLWLGVGMLAGLAYHLLNYETFLELLRRSFAPQSSALANTGYAPPPFAQKLSGFFEFQLGASYFSLALVVLGSLLSFLSLTRNAWLLHLWWLGSFVVLLLLIGPTMPYYFMAVMPVLALLSVSWVFWKPPLSATTSKYVRGSLIILAVVLSAYFAGDFLGRSLGTRDVVRILTKAPEVLFHSGRLTTNPLADSPYWLETYVDGNVATLPYPHYWYADEMLDAVKDVMDAQMIRRPHMVASFTNYEWMTSDFFMYKIWQKGLYSELSLFVPLPPPKTIAVDTFLNQYDFIITKTGKILKNDFYGTTWAEESQQFVEGLLAEGGKMMRRYHFAPLDEFRLADSTNGTVWVHARLRRGFDLMSVLSKAEIIAEPGFVTTTAFTIGAENRLVIYEHPSGDPNRVTEVRWRDLKILKRSILKFGIAMDPLTWSPDKGDGVEYRIDIRSGRVTETIFSRYIDPKNNIRERKWHDFEVSLDGYEGKTVDLIFKTLPGPQGNSYDHAGWSAPTIVPLR